MPTDTIIDMLAVYRLTRLAQRDTFPPIVKVRRRIVRPESPEWVHELAEDCPWCLSVWMALPVLALRRLAPKAWRPLAFMLAASAVTGLITERED